MFNLFSKEPSVEELEEKYGSIERSNPILKNPWISHWFALQYECPKHMSEEKFLDNLQEIQSEVMGYVVPFVPRIKGKSVSIKSLKLEQIPRTYQRPLELAKISKNTYFMLIRFPNIRKQDISKKDVFRRVIEHTEKRQYEFTPVQSLGMMEVSKNIEFQLHAITKSVPHQLMTLTSGINEDVFITDFDGLQYISYPLVKRIELYLDFPDLERKVFSYTLPFKDSIKWILSKEDDSIDMKDNCIRVRSMLKKFKIQI